MAQSKVELLLDIKDRMKTGLTKARDNVTKSTKDMKDKIQSMSASASTSFTRMRVSLARNVADMKVQLHSFKNAVVDSWDEIKKELPMLDRALRLLRNPLVAAAAAMVALGVATTACAKDALKWEEGLAKVNVTARCFRCKFTQILKAIHNQSKL